MSSGKSQYDFFNFLQIPRIVDCEGANIENASSKDKLFLKDHVLG